MHLEVQPVEREQGDDRDRHHRGRGPDPWRGRQTSDHEGEQAVDDHRPEHVAAREAVAENLAACEELGDAGSVRLGQRPRRLAVREVQLVVELEDLGGDEDDEHQGVGTESRAP